MDLDASKGVLQNQALPGLHRNGFIEGSRIFFARERGAGKHRQ
jgi:hypothetical protein